MKKRRFEYGKYTADVFINNRKVTILMNRDGRADSSILDIPLILLKDISHFILESHIAEIEKLIKKWKDYRSDGSDYGYCRESTFWDCANELEAALRGEAEDYVMLEKEEVEDQHG